MAIGHLVKRARIAQIEKQKIAERDMQKSKNLLRCWFSGCNTAQKLKTIEVNHKLLILCEYHLSVVQNNSKEAK